MEELLDELIELKKYISDGKKAIVRILNIIEHNKIDIPVMLDLEQALDMFKYMDGFVDCLEKNELLQETADTDACHKRI